MKEVELKMSTIYEDEVGVIYEDEVGVELIGCISVTNIVKLTLMI
jgi:hypothetical protein